MDNLRNLFSAFRLRNLLVFVVLKMFRANKDLKDFEIKSLFSNWISPKHIGFRLYDWFDYVILNILCNGLISVFRMAWTAGSQA